MSTNSQLPEGQLQPFDNWTKFGQTAFIIRQFISKMQTATLVKVISCTNAGGVAVAGTVNVQPCVNQVDSAGNPYPHTTIWNVPYFRLANAGGNAIILDPQAGDIGLCCFASRDIQQVKRTLTPANPDSKRQYDFSDAMYVGLMIGGGTPTQYIQFTDAGIKIVSPSKITLQAPEIDLIGNVVQTEGTISADTDVIAGPNSISLVNHTHTSESPGSPTSPPIP